MTLSDDDTQTRILRAAGEIFAQRGFEKATIREICRRAEVNLASAHYHFHDKQRLYRAVIRHAHEYAWRQEPFPEWSSDTSAERKLREFVHGTMRRMVALDHMPWQSQLMMREFAQPTGVCNELADDYIRPHFEMMLSILDELLPADFPLHRRQQLGFSLVGQCLFYRLHNPVMHLLVSPESLAKHFDLEMLADHIADVMLAALGREPMFPAAANPSKTASTHGDEE